MIFPIIAHFSLWIFLENRETSWFFSFPIELHKSWHSPVGLLWLNVNRSNKCSTSLCTIVVYRWNVNFIKLHLKSLVLILTRNSQYVIYVNLRVGIIWRTAQVVPSFSARCRLRWFVCIEQFNVVCQLIPRSTGVQAYGKLLKWLDKNMLTNQRTVAFQTLESAWVTAAHEKRRTTTQQWFADHS